ncbi:MAG: LytTR family DNA-binding domain-containing protein [Cyclobacteriaceae bacterium]
MNIRTFIAEDQPHARKGLEVLINNTPEFEVIGSAKNGIEAIEGIRSLQPDLLLLDIQMPGANGFEVLYTLGEKAPKNVIFITAYDQFAIRAFEVNAIDYLLKPYTNKRLEQALDKVRGFQAVHSLPGTFSEIAQLLQFYITQKDLEKENKSITESEQHRFIIREYGKITIVYFDQLLWVEAYDYYSRLHTNKGTFLIRKSLRKIEEELPSVFQRIHRSFIVRMDQVRYIEKRGYGGELYLKNDLKLRVSSRYWKAVKKAFEPKGDTNFIPDFPPLYS